jgi:hypothetical protein
MKCSSPDCNRGIGLVAYQRGWFSKRLYCSKHCRDAFVADAPNLQQKRKSPVLKRFVVAFVAFVGLLVPATFTMAVLAAPPARPEAPHLPGCDRNVRADQKPQRRGQVRNVYCHAVLFSRSGKGACGDRTMQKRCRTRT